MLIIRDSQMQEFRAHRIRDFENRMVALLAESDPEKCRELSDASKGEHPIRALIQEGILRGKEYGITAERDVAVLIELMLRFGSGFEEKEAFMWVRPILSHSNLSGHSKIDFISRRLKGDSIG